MSKRKNHIPEQDYGKHVVTLCGKFPRTLEDCFGTGGVCKRCKDKFIRTPEALEQERIALSNWSKSFNFDKEPKPCPAHPTVLVRAKGGACSICVQEANKYV